MTETIMKVIPETLKISLLVLIMMILVDLINVWTRGKIGKVLKQGKQLRQYVVAPAPSGGIKLPPPMPAKSGKKKKEGC
ncbi:MAG: hypothetical protein KKG06_05590 [Bacteroidetes bacterium]|nr:hypothetical protein [Bacteroidota bacterium]